MEKLEVGQRYKSHSGTMIKILNVRDDLGDGIADVMIESVGVVDYLDNNRVSGFTVFGGSVVFELMTLTQLEIGQKWVAPHGTTLEVLEVIDECWVKVKVTKFHDADGDAGGLCFDAPGSDIISRFRIYGCLPLELKPHKERLWIGGDGSIVRTTSRPYRDGNGCKIADVVVVVRGDDLDFSTRKVNSFMLVGRNARIQFRRMRKVESLEHDLLAAHIEVDKLKAHIGSLVYVAESMADSAAVRLAKELLVPACK